MTDTSHEPFDLLIIGGGINGAGIARDAAGRGLKVALCEMGDLACATSSASSKLIHGGLRYLELLQFRLVRESLAEREILLAIAPHLVRPLRFVMPHTPALRPAWMLRAGLFLYDHLSRRVTLPPSSGVDLTTSEFGTALAPGYRRGFVYSDCQVDDARLVVLNARDAADRGAIVHTRTRFDTATTDGTLWRAMLDAGRGGRPSELQARVLVNATGPWVTRTLAGIPGAERRHRMRPVKGSHIVVPRLYAGEHAFILQNDDGRIVFVIPFEDDYSLIGTTEVGVPDDFDSVDASEMEIDYLCQAARRYLSASITADDVLWSYAGVRPLFDGDDSAASKLSRDYALDLDRADLRAPILNVYGGKLTTYRKLAEHAVDMLAPFVSPMGAPWTATRPLPGGDLPEGGIERLVRRLVAQHPALEARAVSALARRHGSLADEVLAGAAASRGAMRHFGADLYAFEVDYLVAREWARDAEDVLWRRTKAGLHLGADARAELAAYLGRATADAH